MLIGLQELLLIVIVMIILILPEFFRHHKKDLAYRVKLYAVIASLLLVVAIMSRFVFRLVSMIALLLLLLVATVLVSLKSLAQR
jgi:hypothetical protein